MQNVFDAVGYPTAEPRAAVARDRWVWRRPDIAEAYPADAHELSYRFTRQADGAEQEAFATVIDSVYVVEIESTDTESFAAGEWAWEAVILRSADGLEAVVDRGFITVTAASTASHVYRVLQAIRATIEGTASDDQSRIEIAGRVLERRSISELMDLEIAYSRRWQREQSALRRATGKPAGGRVLVGMRA